MVARQSEHADQSLRTGAGARLAPGQVIDDRYEIIECLGAGGMSVVYKSRQLQLDKTCALKILHPRLIADDTAVQRFQREAVAVSSLDHPNIVSVSGFGVWNSQPYMAAELIDGISLAQLVQEHGRLEKQRALTVFNQILDALNHAHERGIIHRDLKPSNVMIADNDFVKLVDFGIAKVLPESGKEMQKLTQTDDIFGTLLYMSPEQCLGYAVDARADIYSMGCLMYEVLTGQPPLQAETAFALMNKQVAEEPTDVSLLDRELAPIVMQCLEKKPEMRPQSAAALKELLACPPASSLQLPYKMLKKQRSKVRRLLPVLVALTIVAVGVLAFTLSRHVDATQEPMPQDPIDENAPRQFEEAMGMLKQDPERAMKIFDQIIRSTDRSSAGIRLKAIEARLAYANGHNQSQLCNALCDRYKTISDSNFPGSVEQQARYLGLRLAVASAENDKPAVAALVAKQFELLAPSEKAGDWFKEEGEILARAHHYRADLEEAAGDSRSAEKDLRKGFKLLDSPDTRKGSLFSHSQSGDALFIFLMKHHRVGEAHSLLKQMEACKKNWNTTESNYPYQCSVWADEYKKTGDHKMAVHWITEAIDHHGDPVNFLRFRAQEYASVGDTARAHRDNLEASRIAHGKATD